MTESEKGEGGRGIFERLADVGEGAIQRVGEMPGMGKIAEPLLALRERVDELQRRVRGLDALERRMSDLEARVGRLDGGTASSSGAGGDAAYSTGPEPAAEPMDLPTPGDL